MKRQLLHALNSVLRHYDCYIVRGSTLDDRQGSTRAYTLSRSRKLPDGAEDYLTFDNPRLRQLEEKYAKCETGVTTPLVWTDTHLRRDDIRYFRGDNAYVWQLRGHNMNLAAYALSTYYVRSIDRLGLLDKLREDNYFGTFTFCHSNTMVSRDLLDSILEMYFLENHLNISAWPDVAILDIGAGYGRLAHRMVTALPNLHRFWCADAVAVSSFICEYYLAFRGVSDRAKVIQLDEIQTVLEDVKIDIAVNIHSFSECTIDAIEWWLGRLEKRGIRYLMVVPNASDQNGKQLLTNDGKDFGRVIERMGYRMVAKAPKYSDPVVQEYGIGPTWHYLFELG